jgi:membrane protease subunit (stomatin/prohibitin family)
VNDEFDHHRWETTEKAKFCAKCGVCAFDTATGIASFNSGEPEVCEGCAKAAIAAAEGE